MSGRMRNNCNDHLELSTLSTMSNCTENFQILLKKFKNGRYVEFLNLLDGSICMDEFCDFYSNIEEGGVKQQSFLHMICELERSISFQLAKDVLARVKNTPDKSSNNLFKFVNQRELYEKEYIGRTPLEIAILKRNQRLIDLLIKHCADVTYALQGSKLPLEEIYSRFHYVMIKQFDRSIELIKDDSDTSNELLWNVKYNFRPIVGVPSILDEKVFLPNERLENYDRPAVEVPSVSDKKRFLQSELLVKILPVTEAKRNEILTHPLTRLFMHEKTTRFKWWIRLSIAAHAIWYIWTALLLTSLVAQKSNNGTENESTSAVAAVSGFLTGEGAILWCHYVVYCIVFVGFAIKEYFELQLAPNKLYYWKQFENIGQWMLLPIVVFTVGWKMFVSDEAQQELEYVSTPICAVGILISILLVQGQLTKIQLCGVYNILLRKAIVRFLKFSFAYSPLLVAFSLVFNLLLHKEKKEFDADFGFVKIFTIFAGELDYKETFDDELPYYSIVTGKVLFVVFVTIVTIILQNILVALTVDDIQGLKQFCLASHIAAELELIHILEGFQSTYQKWHRILNPVQTPSELGLDKKENNKRAQECTEIPIESSYPDNIQILREKDEKLDAKLAHGWREIPLESFPENIQTCIKKYHDQKI